MSSINVLFYSNHCAGSKHLLALLSAEKLTNYFHLICTDNNPKIPKGIKVTPTLIVKGDTTPYVAGEAFHWLTKVKQWKSNKMIGQMDDYPKTGLTNNNQQSNHTIQPFSEAEMTSLSDLFSFFSKNREECKEPLPQSYFPCKSMGRDCIITEQINTFEPKPTSVECQKAYENIEKSRQLQNSQLKSNPH